ncbi:hypothetical protein Tco_0265732 [Tanacetum coccineum]
MRFVSLSSSLTGDLTKTIRRFVSLSGGLTESSNSGKVSSQSRNETSNSDNDMEADATYITHSYDTELMAEVDSNTTPYSSNMCNNEFEDDQHADDHEDECVCKSALDESNDIQDRCRTAFHDQDIEFEKYDKYINCQLEKEEVERKYKETLGLSAQRKHDSNEAFNLKRKTLS